MSATRLSSDTAVPGAAAVLLRAFPAVVSAPRGAASPGDRAEENPPDVSR